jgi:hypothetical protein
MKKGQAAQAVWPFSIYAEISGGDGIKNGPSCEGPICLGSLVGRELVAAAGALLHGSSI